MARSPSELAAYRREKKAASIPIYFQSEEEKRSFQKLARDAGFTTFTAWAVQTLLTTGSGQLYPPGYVEQLQAEAEKLRGWLDQKNAELEELRRETKILSAQLGDARVVLTRLGQHGEAERARARGLV